MRQPLITLDLINRVLRNLGDEHGGRPQLEFDLSDPRVDWEHIGRCDNGGLPAVDHGQERDCRFSMQDGASLHAHWFPARTKVRFHRDRVDPREDALGHLLADTTIAEAAGIGALGGLLLSKGSGWGALLGAAAGGIVGLATESLPAGGVWVIDEVRENGRWTAHRIDRVAEAVA